MQRAAAAAAAPAEEAEEPASGRRSRRAKREAGAVGGMGRRSELPDDLLPKVAIVGRPNVGKSGAHTLKTFGVVVEALSSQSGSLNSFRPPAAVYKQPTLPAAWLILHPVFVVRLLP